MFQGRSDRRRNRRKRGMTMRKTVVVDLEMCKVPSRLRTKAYHYKMETIQIGAVRISENLEIEDTFNCFVRPEYGVLDCFVENLTGIHEGDLQNALVMKEVLEAFLAWVPEEAVVASWSYSDRDQIRKEANAKGLMDGRLEQMLNEWVDCQEQFGRKINATRQYGLQEALFAADMEMTGNAHDGLSDAYNTAQLLIRMETDPKLKLNPLYEGIRSGEHEVLSFSLGEMFEKLQIQIG